MNPAKEIGAAAAALAVFGSAGLAAAQGALEPHVSAQLSEADSAVRATAVATVNGRLAKGAARNHSVPAVKGVYVAVGACDKACPDLNLRLLDREGELINEDVLTDNMPLVMAEVAVDTTFVLDVRMVDCGAADCAYGVRVYRQ